MANWIKLTDGNDVEVRVNVETITHYRSNDGAGTTIGLGGTGKDRLVITVKELPEKIDAMIAHLGSGKAG
jgi:hypothetical protein